MFHISDTSFHHIASSDARMEDDYLKDVVTDSKDGLKVDLIRKISTQDIIWADRSRPYPIPGDMGVSGGLVNLYANRQHLGWIVFAREGGALTRAELDVLDGIGETVRFWMASHGAEWNLAGASGVFLDILEGSYDG